jgi:betaine reductase
MSTPLRVVHYVNQFFAGVGGEEQAHVGVSVREGAVGPGRPLAQALAAVAGELERLRSDVIVAGPAFGSGRYGLACAHVCRIAGQRGMAAVTAMHPENPGATGLRRIE